MANPAEGSGRLPVDCENCRASIDGLCKECSQETLRILAAFKARDRKIKAGDDLFRSSEPSSAIYNLIRGWVFLYTLLEDGRRQVLHFALPGAVLGFQPARGMTMTYSAQALTDTLVYVIPHDRLNPLCRDYPEIAMRLAWLASRDCNLAYDRLFSIGRQSARQRVARLLLELSARYRAQWHGKRTKEVPLPLTQKHIGDATGLTGVHVNRVLRELRRDDIVEFRYRRLRVLNPDKLVDAAGVDRHVATSLIRTL